MTATVTAPKEAVAAPPLRPWDHDCEFPGCAHEKTPGSVTCAPHARVRVSSTGSWVNDRHTNGGHG